MDDGKDVLCPVANQHWESSNDSWPDIDPLNCTFLFFLYCELFPFFFLFCIMAHAPPSPTQSTSNHSIANNINKGREPTLSTDVDNPSHPLYHHRRIVTDFDYGEILGEGSYSTVSLLKH